MSKSKALPKTLIEAVRFFADPDVCLEIAAELRWPNGPTCPQCESQRHSFLKTRRIWKCLDCKKQYSVKQGSIFEESAISLDKWLVSIWLVANCKNGISSYELARSIGVTQKSGWFVLQRIRLAMQTGSFKKLSGEVEADESFIGGKARNMHASKRKTRIHGRGTVGKAIVMGMLERKGQVLATVVETRRKHEVQAEIRQHVEPGSTVYTDELLSYDGLDSDYAHKVINHAEEHVRGNIHTNGMENFWSLLKRTLSGTYVSVEPFHLFRYLDEQAYRFNNREGSDLERFVKVLANASGRRLTYTELTGKDERPS